ncbi:MAG: undecaprenyl-diphosphate phosphatase [Planctomycetota bacterium]
MEWWQAVILGLVEGITEYLPVSSTGHLILASALMGLDTDPVMKSNVDAFNIVIQGGAILAVLGLYRARVAQMIKGVFGKDPAGLKLAMCIVVAFMPAAIFGVMLDDWIEERLFFAGPVLAALALGGVYMIVLDRWKVRPMRTAEATGVGKTGLDLDGLTLKAALVIGLFQCLAMWPGTSRSMMTITAAVIVGLRPRAAAEFSFLLGLPTLGGACVYKLAKNLKESADAGTPNLFEALGWTPVILGLVVATISAAFAVKWLVSFLNKHGLSAFGWYRLILTAALGGAIAAGVVRIGPPDTEPDPVSQSIDAATSSLITPCHTDPDHGGLRQR